MKVVSKQPKKETRQPETKPTQSKRAFTVTGTGYTASCSGCSGITATGINVRRYKRIIAVDPSVIPLGTTVKLTSPGYPAINGTYLAADTGGAIKGHKIDILFPSTASAIDFGRRTDILIELF